jgi:predicted transcriptional regulator
MNTEEVDPHLTAKIVASYVRHHKLGPDQLSDLITSVHRAIGQLRQPPLPDEVLTPASRFADRYAMTCDRLIAAIEGRRCDGNAIRNRIKGNEHRQRSALKSDHPLTFPAYSERRSTLAKALGLGRKSMKEAAPTATPAASPPVDEAGDPKARRTRRSRPASRSQDATSHAAEPTPARRRRSRARIASPPVGQTISPTAES